MQQLLDIMQLLREKCPWDQAQTPHSLTRYAIEEAYEVEAAIREGDAAHIKEELGDLLLQVIFQSQMHAEQGLFDFNDVVEVLTQKLIRRHPHVFDENEQQLDEQQVALLWQDIKRQEKKAQDRAFVSRLDQIKVGPSMAQAQKLQHHAAQMRFDWDNVQGAFDKLEEEVGELKAAIETQDPAQIQDELGDCLFSMVNVGRKLNQDCEIALLGTVHKFRTRFAYIEAQLYAQNLQPEQCDLTYLDQLWDAAKQHERQYKNNSSGDIK